MFKSAADVQTIVDAKDAAEWAGLRYVSDARPGIQRRRAGKGFTYTRADGSRLRERDTLRRIKVARHPARLDECMDLSVSGRTHPGYRSGRPPEVLTSYLDGNLVLEIKSAVETELREELEGLKPEEAAVLVIAARPACARHLDKPCERKSCLISSRSGETEPLESWPGTV